MLGDFDLITHTFPDTITVYPVADVHLGAIEHCEREWQSFLTKVKTEGAYLILAGDLLNNSVKSAGFANPFDEAIRPREAKKLMAEYLMPLRERILCVVTGNHERRTYRDDDQDLTYDICSKLDIEDVYRENIAFMTVGVGTRNTAPHPLAVYSFAVTHGAGGGIYTGATVNRNERFGNIIEGIDCFVAAHTHKGTITKPSKIVVDVSRKRVSMRSYVAVSCVSWLNYGGYPAQKLLLPAHVAEPQKLTLVANKDVKKIITTW